MSATQILEIQELSQGIDITCSGCDKLLYKYPQNIEQVGLKLQCNHYYHLKCFRELCNEADEDSFPRCYDCNQDIDITDCINVDYILENPMHIQHPEKFFAIPDPEGGGKKTKKRRRKRKTKKRRRKKKGKTKKKRKRPRK